MTEERTTGRIVLVAIDASPPSLTALESAATLASRLNAELRGMYVEDADLMRTAELPFACAITSLGQTHRLTPETMLRQLNRHAELARNAVESAGIRSNLSWSFTVARGTVFREIAQAASTADFVTVGRSGWADSSIRQLGSVASALANLGTTSLLLVGEGGVREPVAVIHDGSTSSDRALALAAALDINHTATVFVVGPMAAERLKRREILPKSQIVTADSSDVFAKIQRSGARTVIIPSASFTESRDWITLLERKSLSVFLVR
jgi:nucleotide-binding universal stress UspA family protein